MAVFVYRGVNRQGKTVKGVLDADNQKALRGTLRRDGIMVTEVLEESVARVQRSREIDFSRFFNRAGTMDIAMATRQLATLLKAGIPLVEALSALIDQIEKPVFQSAFTQVRDRVNEGTSLADALRPHGQFFSSLFVNMVSAGEASGTLDVVLARLADFLESQAKLKSKVIGALAYPVFMIFLMIGIVFLMMVVVVPKVTKIFEDFNKALPWYTELIIFVSNFLASWWWALAILAVGAAVLFFRWRKTEEGKHTWDQVLLKLPVFGKLVLLVAVARFARTLATLLESGVPVLRSMEITKNVLGNSALMKVVEDARKSVREGESIAVPLKKSGKFPPIVTHMIAIGERSGQLEEMLENVADAYDVQVENRIIGMTALLEPLIIVFMGIIVGSVAFAILMPLLRINEFVAG